LRVEGRVKGFQPHAAGGVKGVASRGGRGGRGQRNLAAQQHGPTTNRNQFVSICEIRVAGFDLGSQRFSRSRSAAFLQKLLHHGFLAGLQFEDATICVNPFSHFRRRYCLPAGHDAILHSSAFGSQRNLAAQQHGPTTDRNQSALICAICG
jgi:hypothetical protein